MNARVRLAADLARTLVEDGPCSGTRLALRVHARKRDVLDLLRDGADFEQVGSGRYAQWQLAAQDRRGTGQEPLQGDATAQAVLDVLLRLQALERRVDTLERKNGAWAAS